MLSALADPSLTDHTNFYYCRWQPKVTKIKKSLTDHTNFYYCR